jgi:Beta-galactosidase/beta-glucuronidase
MKFLHIKRLPAIFYLLVIVAFVSTLPLLAKQTESASRERISINNGWRFFKYASEAKADNLRYDVRPEVTDNNDSKAADSKPTEAIKLESAQNVLKTWIFPTGNAFIKDPQKRYVRPSGNPGGNFPFVQSNFDDNSWETVDLPHDWAIKGPFQKGTNPEVGGGMGRLPVNGVAWYRKKIDIPASDAGKSIFLDIDGAMSYAIVWCNGKLVGGWPYGYNSWRVDLTPYVLPEKINQLAIRVDNPNYSARWYPGAGLYRNVWLLKTNPVHVAQYGTYITTTNVSSSSATINLVTLIDNRSNKTAKIEIVTKIYPLDEKGNKATHAAAVFMPAQTSIAAGESGKTESAVVISHPRLWGPPPTQTPNLYVAVTILLSDNKPIDTYETRFGIRDIEYNPDKGLLVNGEHITIKGINQHHDLGALGAAFNTRAAERQLEILREMGCNAIRFSHNPPAPELLELTDKMGFLVIDEIFDSWERKKTPLDFHLIFPDWSEQDTRTFVRRDRNCPSIIMWSFGNEVGEQYTGEDGAKIAARLRSYVKDEDPTRPTTGAMNYAKPDMPLPAVLDVIGLNYQGEGIRQDSEFEGTDRIRTVPQYDPYHQKFPNKMIVSTETASAASSRGVYLFPVSSKMSAPIRDGEGGDSKICQVSSYELHAVDFGSSADKVFSALDHHPFVAGEFVWNGFDYIGEPTPYYEARSSYTGIIDLAGFKKDRFYLYQAHWRPELPMAHILPHWNWPDRIGKITPVHVFTSGDEAELFLNGKSLGKKVKGQFEYRLRWDSVRYEPGELTVISYKNGSKWAEETVKTTGTPSLLTIEPDRNEIKANGKDLAFITIKVTDKNGLVVPIANNPIEFSIEGCGEIVVTDNGDSTDMTAFPSKTRDAFNGLCLVIIRSKAGQTGNIKVTAKSPGLTEAHLNIVCK